ncbi:MAG: RDD family protein [Ginsengibacter sp.]
MDLEFELAGAHKRLLAYLIDFTILLLFFKEMKFYYYGGFDLSDTGMLRSHVGLDILTISVPMLLYSLVSEIMMNGQTIGKKLLNIRVISLGGGQPSLSQYILRWMFKAFEWPFFFGYTFFSLQSMLAYIIITGFWGVVVLIFIAINKRNQRLGDMAANTVVINTQSPFPWLTPFSWISMK